MRVHCYLSHLSNQSFNLISRYQYLFIYFIDIKIHRFQSVQNNSLNSTDTDIFYAEQSSTQLSPQRHNTPEILNSTELPGTPTIEHITLSSEACPEPQLITIHSDSNEPTIPYRYGRQYTIVPPSLNDLTLPANPFDILATMEVVHQTAVTHGEKCSPQSPEPSDSSPISTPPMNLSKIRGWETPHTTIDDNIFFSDEEPERIFFLPSSPSPPTPPRQLKIKMSCRMSFSNEGSVAARLRSLRADFLYKREHSQTL